MKYRCTRYERLLYLYVDLWIFEKLHGDPPAAGDDTAIFQRLAWKTRMP